MTANDLVRAWKDPDERGADVDHPAGEILLDSEFSGGGGQFRTERLSTLGCNCDGLTTDWDACVGWTKFVTCLGGQLICAISYAAGC